MICFRVKKEGKKGKVSEGISHVTPLTSHTLNSARLTSLLVSINLNLKFSLLNIQVMGNCLQAVRSTNHSSNVLVYMDGRGLNITSTSNQSHQWENNPQLNWLHAETKHAFLSSGPSRICFTPLSLPLLSLLLCPHVFFFVCPTANEVLSLCSPTFFPLFLCLD